MVELGDLGGEMASLARDLSQDTSAAEAEQTIVDCAVTLIAACEVAGITIATRRGEVRSPAITDDVASRNDQIQQEMGEGPCLDAVWEERIVRVPDLREEKRWPKWAARTIEANGVLSMLCVQLFTHDNLVGALNLFSSKPNAFGEDEEEEAVAIAAHAAVALVAAEDVAGLRTAISSRTVIGQATGMVMVQYGLTDTRAFEVLVRLSSHQNRKLAVIARQIVDDWNAQLDVTTAATPADGPAPGTPGPR